MIHKHLVPPLKLALSGGFLLLALGCGEKSTPSVPAVKQKASDEQKVVRALIFASDLPERDTVVGLGDFGKNGSCGYFNREIRKNGNVASKGISTHCKGGAPVGVTYEVPAEARRFLAIACITDDTDRPPTSPITFRVLSEDGTPLWTSPTAVDDLSDIVLCDLPLGMAKTIRLEASCTASSDYCCAVWLNPCFVFDTQGIPEPLRSWIDQKGVAKPAEKTNAKKSRDPAIDPTTVEKLMPEEVRQLIASSGEDLSLPSLRDLSEEAANELATYGREKRVTRTYEVMVPVQEEKTATYTVMVCVAEDKLLDDGTKTSVKKCQPEERTRTYTVTKMIPEQKTRSITLPYTLQLDALAAPEPSVLAALAKHDGNLHLNAIKTLTPDQAQSLAAHKGGTLALDRLESLDLETATHLASRQGDLSLNGLSSLSPESADALSGHKGDLSLNGVKVLIDEVAAAIGRHVGPVSLRGVQNASEEALGALAGKPVTLPTELLSQSQARNENE
jgi:hypothetical protein